jgi:hypothetical protein
VSWIDGHGIHPVSVYAPTPAPEPPCHLRLDGVDSEPPIEPELADVLSPTQVSSVMDCPYRWYAKYALEIPDVQSSNLALGKAVHAAILNGNMTQKVETKVDLPIAGVIAIFREAWAIESDQTEFRADENRTELGRCGELLVGKYMDEAAPHIEPAAVELPVEGMIGGVQVRGFVDLLDVNGRVIDIKTAKARPSIIEPMAKFQVATYRALTPGATGKGMIQTLVKTKTPRLVNQSFLVNDEELRATETIYPTAQALMRGGIFLPNRRSMLCSRRCCSFWGHCESEWGGVVPET